MILLQEQRKNYYHSSKKGLGWRSVAAHKKSLEVGFVQRTATISERRVAEIQLNKINALS